MSDTAWVQLAIETGAKGAVVLALGLGVMVLMGRSSPAARHFVLALAMLSAAALVPFGRLLPTWQVSLLPAPGTAAAPTLRLPEVSLAVPRIAPAIPAESEQHPGEPPITARIANVTFPGFAPWDAVSTLPLPLQILGVWLTGVAVVLASYVVGFVGIAGLRRRSTRVTNTEQLALVQEISRMLGIARRVTLYTSTRADMPLTWGTIRPSILLPAESSAWTSAQLRAVMHHELAHIARGDCGWNLVAVIACAVHWFNPLTWIAARRLRAERERACDDMVLEAGTDACDYADHLLGVARQFHAPRSTAMAAIAMARPSQLEGRVLSILDSSAPRRAPGVWWRAASAVAMGLVLLPTAAMRPWRELPEAPASASNATTTVRSEMEELMPLEPLPPLPAIADTLRWTRRMSSGQWLKVYTMRSAVHVERSTDENVHVITIFGADDGRGPRQHEFDEDERQIEVCPALPAGVKRVPVSGCWPVDWKGEVERDNALQTIVRVPDDILLDIKTSTGDIVATDARTTIVAGSVDGSIRLTSAAFASANTVNGDVDVRFTRAEWPGTTALKTVSGRIAVQLPSSADTDVEVMSSTGETRTSFVLDEVWRGAQWRFHGAARLGRGGRKVSVESWTGKIVVTRDGESDLIPMRLDRSGLASARR